MRTSVHPSIRCTSAQFAAENPIACCSLHIVPEYTRDIVVKLHAQPGCIAQLVTRGLRAMLKEDRRAVEGFKQEVNEAGQLLAEQGDRDAAVFMYVLLQLADNKLAKESLKLTGSYLTAFEKLYALLEESGWKLRHEDADASSDDDAEALPLPSVGSYS